MVIPYQPPLSKVDVWMCKLCWVEQQGINNSAIGESDAPARGWTRLTADDKRCYCCGAPVREAINVTRYLDLDTLDSRAKVWP